MCVWWWLMLSNKISDSLNSKWMFIKGKENIYIYGTYILTCTINGNVILYLEYDDAKIHRYLLQRYTLVKWIRSSVEQLNVYMIFYIISKMYQMTWQSFIQLELDDQLPDKFGENKCVFFCKHYDDVIMTTLASQITSLTVVYSIVYSGVDQRKHQSSASLAFVRWIHRDRWIPRTKGQ